MRKKFLSGLAIFFLVLDEIPVDAKDLTCIGKLRDELKTVDNIVLILSGTNSKAANMKGISTRVVSFSATIEVGDCWSRLVTRMPRFFLQSSPHFQFWSTIQSRTVGDRELERVVKAISISINGNGNPRLINMAISALEQVYVESSSAKPFTFLKWQRKFSTRNPMGKFLLNKWS